MYSAAGNKTRHSMKPVNSQSCVKRSILRFTQTLLILSVFLPVDGLEPEPTLNPFQFLCADRHGYLSVERFHHRACTMCYTYLFLATKPLAARFPFESLVFRNQSISDFDGPIVPDPKNDTSMDLVCSTLNRQDCRRWTSCCEAASACCDRQRTTARPTHIDQVCLRTWDGYSCWDDAKPGTKETRTCPSFMDRALESRRAIKECTLNATWAQNRGLEWTDYRDCVDIESFLENVYICVGCNAASLLLLLPSIVIFFVFRDLTRQHRIRMHINFFLALLLRSVVVILWFLLVHHEKIVNQETSSSVMRQNPIWCRVLSFFKIYLDSTTYSWMFCEGYYLHRLISRAFEPPKSLLTLYLLGWGCPAIPAVIYSVLRVIYGNESCWAFSISGYMQWVLYGPNLLCLLLNIAFLCNILRILLFQLHSHPHEPSNFRRGLKAAFMLIPLFGIQLVLTIYRPNSVTEANYKAYEYASTVVINSQGVFVSLIFCFFNGEVLAHFHDRCCTCGKRCMKPFIRTRSPSSHFTQVTMGEDRRSPSNSIHSHNSTTSRRNGKLSVPSFQDIDLHELSVENVNNLLHKQNGLQPNTKSGYAPVPTT